MNAGQQENVASGDSLTLISSLLDLEPRGPIVDTKGRLLAGTTGHVVVVADPTQSRYYAPFPDGRTMISASTADRPEGAGLEPVAMPQ